MTVIGFVSFPPTGAFGRCWAIVLGEFGIVAGTVTTTVAFSVAGRLAATGGFEEVAGVASSAGDAAMLVGVLDAVADVTGLAEGTLAVGLVAAAATAADGQR